MQESVETPKYIKYRFKFLMLKLTGTTLQICIGELMYSIEALMLQIDEPISKVSFQNLFSRINITHTRLPAQGCQNSCPLVSHCTRSLTEMRFTLPQIRMVDMAIILKLKRSLPCQKELINCTLIIEGKQSPTEA